MSYPSSFDEALKERVRQRYGYRCAQCGLSQQECQSIYGQSLSVHHKDENKQNSDIANLEALCKKCHQGTHFHKQRRT